MYYSSANFSGWVWLKGKSHKTFDSIMSTKLFFLISIFGEWGAATPPPPWVLIIHLHWFNLTRMTELDN